MVCRGVVADFMLDTWNNVPFHIYLNYRFRESFLDIKFSARLLWEAQPKHLIIHECIKQIL